MEGASIPELRVSHRVPIAVLNNVFDNFDITIDITTRTTQIHQVLLGGGDVTMRTETKEQAASRTDLIAATEGEAGDQRWMKKR